MPVNDHLSPLLDAYVALSDPGFAVMVTATWGVGKTHAVRGWLDNRPHLYVSLFGVDSVAAAQEAVFIAALDQTDAAQTRLRAKGADALSKLAGGAIAKATGVSVDLSGAYRNLVLKHAPKLMILDDLERAQLPSPLLLGLINRYVEHEGRSVILLANEAELDNSGDYRRWREKVVGRTINLAPDTESALTVFLAQVPDGPARAFLSTHRDLLRQVFDLSETQNLRLLRQAMLEWARFYSGLPPDITGNAEGMRHLFADFAALTLAYHGAKIDREDLGQEVGWERAAWRFGGCQGEEPPENGLEKLLRRYNGFPAMLLNGCAIPGDLAKRLIGDGHFPPHEIGAALRGLGLFSNLESEPWLLLRNWRALPDARVSEALEKAQAQLAARHFTDPRVILHLFGTHLDLSDYGLIPQSRAQVVDHALAYITELETTGHLPGDLPAKDWRRGLEQKTAFGIAYSGRDTPEFDSIYSSLIAALDRAFKAENPRRAQDLLMLFEASPHDFRALISGIALREGLPRYADERIFLDADPATVAQRLFAGPPTHWSDFLRPFKDRIRSQEGTFRPDEHPVACERDWLMQFRAYAAELAEASTPVRRAQIRAALADYLSFLDTPD